MLREGFNTFEVNVTQRCNAVCEYCDRLVGVVRIRNSDVTGAQMRWAIREMQAVGYRPNRISIAGGEPFVNPHLNDIIAAFRPLNRNIAVLTNCVQEYRLPRQGNGKRIWFKHAALENKEHVPFLVSPDDAGYTKPRRNCAIQGKCGIAFDAFGFSMCPVAVSLGHILKINPYEKSPTSDRIMSICKHCPHNIPRGDRLEMYERVRTGEIEYPTPTLAKALEDFERDPIAYPRFAEVEQPEKKTARVRLPIVQPVGYIAKGVRLPSKFPIPEVTHDVPNAEQS